MAPISLEFGERNRSQFYQHYRYDNNYVFVKLFDNAVFSGTSYDGCIVEDLNDNIKKLVLFIYQFSLLAAQDRTQAATEAAFLQSECSNLV